MNQAQYIQRDTTQNIVVIITIIICIIVEWSKNGQIKEKYVRKKISDVEVSAITCVLILQHQYVKLA